jgi:hypothetical protein
MCNCGAIIDYSLKRCEDCEKKYKVNKTEANRIYDKECRDKDSAAIYHSKQWERITDQCKARFKGLDIYSYYVLGKVEYGNICHHIIEVKDDKDRAYDLENIIYLSSSNHNIIHGLYKTDYEGTKKMLFDLIERWKHEYSGC